MGERCWRGLGYVSRAGPARVRASWTERAWWAGPAGASSTDAKAKALEVGPRSRRDGPPETRG